METQDLLIGQASVGLMVLGTVQALKMAGMPSKWAPVVSIGIGALLGGLYAISSSTGLIESVLAGVIAGISAGGIQSGIKASERSLDKK